ncbi:hypothetical protein [Escherichia coli]|uniref:hypothetical protein n=1 Tax=Escherichia coli TaxID=562 RepID=UPI00201AAFEC|nr:hypothetical protein [Escherichia coli]
MAVPAAMPPPIVRTLPPILAAFASVPTPRISRFSSRICSFVARHARACSRADMTPLRARRL